MYSSPDRAHNETPFQGQDYSLADLVGLDELNRLLGKFSTLTGMAVSVVDARSREVVMRIGWNPACEDFHRQHPLSVRACQESRKSLSGQFACQGQIRAERCGNGLIDGVTPIVVEGRHLADLHVGQVFFDLPDLDAFRRQAERYGYDPKAYLEAIKAVPVVSEAKFHEALEYLSSLAELVSTLGLKSLREMETRQFRESAQSYRRMFDLAADPILIHDVRGRILDANHLAAQWLGYPVERLTKMTLRDPNLCCEGAEMPVAKGAARQVFEASFLHRNGTPRRAEVSSRGVEYRGKGAILCILRDISRRKAAEQALARSSKNYRVLAGCNHALIHSLSEEELLSRACKLIVEEGGYLSAWIGYADANEEKTVRPVAQAGVEREYLESVGLSWGDNERGQGPTGQAIRSGDPIVATGACEKPGFKIWRQASAEWGFSSSITLPLSIEGRLLGVLNIYAVEEDAFEPEAVDLFSEVAANLSFGIAALRQQEISRQAEEIARERREQYQAFFENSQTVMVLIDLEAGIIVDANQFACTFYGYSRDRFVGKKIAEISMQTREEICRELRMASLKEPRAFTAQHRMADGVIRDVEIFRGLVYVRGRELLYSIVQDVTEKKKAEVSLRQALAQAESLAESLEKANADLEGKNDMLNQAYADLKSSQELILRQEKMASIGQLAAGVAHEVNNPVAFISSNLTSLGKYLEKLTEYMDLQETALKSLTDETLIAEVARRRKKLKIDLMLEDLSNIVSESLDGTERVQKIVQGLKSFARIDDVEPKPAHINDGLESTLNIVWNEIKYKASVNRQYGNIPPVMGHANQLNQVFMNLIVNAAHAINGQGEITVRTWADGERVCVSVADTGEGIPADVQQRIFEPFFTTKEVGKGTGLGLSIAHEIIQKHGGEIRLESEPGRGTTFTVSLPGFFPDSGSPL